MSALSLGFALLLAQPPQSAPVVSISAAELVRAPHLTITGAPVWRTGGAADGPHSFVRVLSGTFMQRGRVALFETEPPEVRVYDAVGKHVVSFGRKGRGPGEFEEGLRLVPHRGDSLVVSQVARVSVFDRAGNHARTISTNNSVLGYAIVVRMFANGTMLTQDHAAPPRVRLLSVIEVPTKLRVLDFDGDRVLVVERDADDLEYVALYRLVRQR